MRDRLTHRELLQRIAIGHVAQVELDQAEAHRLRGFHGDARCLGDPRRLIARDVPDPVGAVAEQRRDLRRFVGDAAILDPPDRRLALRTAGEVLAGQLHIHVLARREAGDAIRPGADRLLERRRRVVRAIEPVRQHRQDGGEIVERRRERRLQQQPERVGVDLLRALDPADVADHRDLVAGIADIVVGVDGIGGGEGTPVLPFDVVAQREFERGGIDPAPALRQQRPVLPALRVAPDQRVPDLLAGDHHHLAGHVVIRIDRIDRVGARPAQRVGCVLCVGELRRGEREQYGDRSSHCGSGEGHGHILRRDREGA